jgi:hypothetical protein
LPAFVLPCGGVCWYSIVLQAQLLDCVSCINTNSCCYCCCCRNSRLTKDTANWKNKQDMLDSEQGALAGLQAQLAELNQEELDARVAAATAARDEAAAGLQAAEHAVEAATRELAGVWQRGKTVANPYLL